MRTGTINPCAMKGETSCPKGMRPDSGGRPSYWAPCECIAKWRSAVSRRSAFRFGMEREMAPTTEAGTTVRLADKGNGGNGAFLVTIPCQETFRNIDSEGTLVYRALSGSSFPGCKLVEEYLLKKKLVRVEPIAHFLGLEGFLVDAFFRVSPLRGTKAARILSYFGDQLCFLLDAIFVPERRQVYFESQIRGVSSPIAEFMAASPTNAKRAQMRRLIESGHFNYDLKLRTAAWLISRNYTSEEEILDVMPAFPMSEFASLQSRVYWEVSQTLPERLKVFPAVWKTLTRKQRHVVKWLYMKGIGISMARYARLLHLSIDSVKDRRDGALAKFKKAYPELAASAPPPNAIADTETSVAAISEEENEDSTHNGPIFHYKPKTGTLEEIVCRPTVFRKEMRKPGVNVAQIQKWAIDKTPRQRFHW